MCPRITKGYASRRTQRLCRCDEITYCAVQECRRRGFILGRAPDLPIASHRASETPRLDQMSSPRRLDELVSSARNSDVCGGTYSCTLYAQVSERSVAIAATRAQQRTAVLCLLTSRFALCVADLPSSSVYRITELFSRIAYRNRGIFCHDF